MAPSSLRVEIHQYRTLPSLRFTLSRKKKPVDLTDKVVYVKIGHLDSGEVFINRACTILGIPTEGRCDFMWAAGDTDVPDSNLDGELFWELPDGRTQTLMTFRVAIKPSLA